MREYEVVSAPYNRLTFMLSLPRSRSAWMAEFLRPFCASASWHCPLQQCASIEELGAKVDNIGRASPGRIFIADVAAMFFFDRLLARFPGAQYLVVHRPAREVENSMRQLGITPPLNVRKAERQLLDIGESIRMQPWAMTGTYFELHSPQVLSAICRFATGAVPPPRHLHDMMQRKVEVSIADQRLHTDVAKQRALFGQARIIH